MRKGVGRVSSRAALVALTLVIGQLLACMPSPEAREGGLFGRRQADKDQAGQHTLNVNGLERTYVLHTPRGTHSGKLPLVFVFHGGRGTGSQIKSHSGFDRVADEHGFVVVYPDSTGNWRDGRETTGEGWEDIEFVRAMIDHLERTENIDRRRVYSTGISNGGIFTLRLACDASNMIAAFAPVAASMPEAYEPKCNPTRPVPMMIIHGSADEWVPYVGGPVKEGLRKGGGGAGGKVIPVPATVEFWRQHNNCSGVQPLREFRDPDKSDETSVQLDRYQACKPGSALTVIRIMGGGHTWPGSPKRPGRLVTRLVGPTSRDISASDVIWAFFDQFALPDGL